MVRDGLLEGVMPEGGRGSHPWGKLGEGILSGAHSKCKGPEVGMSLVYLQNEMGEIGRAHV